MAAKIAYAMQLPATRIEPANLTGKPSGSLRVTRRLKEWKRQQLLLISPEFQPNRVLNRQRGDSLEVSCSPASVLESESFYAPLDDESLILMKKMELVEPYLRGRNIYLVGMMGSGKTTVGKVLSQALDYLFCDSDALVEEEVPGHSVASIFERFGEDYFRHKESNALQRLSLRNRLVVSTGGGAVTQDINWKYMNTGISVWIDVPLEELANRIAAVGTHSRPLLHQESGDPYTKALTRLSALFEERHKDYRKATARVSLENIAAKLGHGDVSNITPVRIAIEVVFHPSLFMFSHVLSSCAQVVFEAVSRLFPC
ncbi:hypothetical protein Tsubulata_036891 [Turnera subulata]|uniref:shikimate kinase n=1 Tax=Turnera subulata TaxID=218843 RepID=A0A9Q0GAJ3_9ROSI|nr:hypothetical protein Tsubulata_036891 [Turnera subulata]